MEEKIKTYVVNGFIESGKTTYIQNCIFHDFFYKRGTTLIISFEQGEVQYDINKLEQYKTNVIYYDNGDVNSFLKESIDNYQPDRIYLENNIMLDNILNKLDERMNVVFTHTLIAKDNFDLYFNNMRQMIQDMVKASNMVTFNRFDKVDDIQKYSNAFRLMNNKCTYLFKNNMGYSEKAFGLFLPYDINQQTLNISDDYYPVFFLDSNENPSKYENKIVNVVVQIKKDEDNYLAGRTVMTCCIADIQFLSYPLLANDLIENSYYNLEAKLVIKNNQYGLARLTYKPINISLAKQPENLILKP